MREPRNYTRRKTVRMDAHERAAIESALDKDVPVATALRDATLKAIGRSDLILDTALSGKSRAAPAVDNSAMYYVKLTDDQYDAIDTASRELNVAMSALMRDSLLKSIGKRPRKAFDQWYARGKRRSQMSPPDPEQQPKKKRKR